MLLRCTPQEGIVTGTDAGLKYAEKYRTWLFIINEEIIVQNSKLRCTIHYTKFQSDNFTINPTKA